MLSPAPRYGAIIVAESTDRYLRHHDYHADTTLLPTVGQFEDLKARAQGVTLATVLPPDATKAEVSSHQKKRGQRAKGNKGGRPAKKPRDDYKPSYKDAHNRIGVREGVELDPEENRELRCDAVALKVECVLCGRPLQIGRRRR